MNKKVLTLFLAIASLGLMSCNSNDDETGIVIDGIDLTKDVDCCSAEEALQVYKFIQTVRIIPELSTTVDGKYDVWAYSKTGTLHRGYNDLYFVVTKKKTGNYVKFFDIKNITPLMHMVKMDMWHSTPVGSTFEVFDTTRPAVKQGWVSLLMNTSDAGNWVFSYDIEVLGSKGGVQKQAINVDALPDGQDWLKNFKIGDDTYFLSLVNPSDWKTGKNTIQAYISKKSNPITTPYALATETFTVEIDPRMPDMGNHTSPDNVALTQQQDGSYTGTINLTMTGLWRIHLTVKDSKGNVVAGGDDLKDGFSSLFWDVTL
jgi:hypothetical protein